MKFSDAIFALSLIMVSLLGTSVVTAQTSCGDQAAALEACGGSECADCGIDATSALQWGTGTASKCDIISGAYCDALTSCGAEKGCKDSCPGEWEAYEYCIANTRSAFYSCGQNPCGFATEVAAAKEASSAPYSAMNGLSAATLIVVWASVAATGAFFM